ncbi:SDR family oxidoreductase [Variovorax sp. J2P1-59]|uniref:SDR family NAD(P)-dependent oxidoreductase n=1 Tax=Variovorax flavidus TaxID=3053501 RepID=UPI0025783031|nr:SDR family oxidoreductase [Variovorax sp. J2P1-59]MDM0074773.1 SDR family oxidoreductase [Variovorax sp. J2P1-59]
MKQQFADKVVLITGGGAGIGRAAALQFAGLGARVVVTGRRAGHLEALAKEHPGIDYLIADVANPDDAQRTVSTVIEKFGALDVLVNNAGAGAILPLAQANAAQVAHIFAVNVIGPSLLATAALPHLKASRGTIVNLSSTFGHKAAASLSHYAASKAAVEHMTRCWALELAADGIRVNAVAAGPTETDFLVERMQLTSEQAEEVKASERRQIPLGRRGVPDEVAAWIVSLASPSAAWITGQVITVDGGLDAT